MTSPRERQNTIAYAKIAELKPVGSLHQSSHWKLRRWDLLKEWFPGRLVNEPYPQSDQIFALWARKGRKLWGVQNWQVFPSEAVHQVILSLQEYAEALGLWKGTQGTDASLDLIQRREHEDVAQRDATYRVYPFQEGVLEDALKWANFMFFSGFWFIFGTTAPLNDLLECVLAWVFVDINTYMSHDNCIYCLGINSKKFRSEKGIKSFRIPVTITSIHSNRFRSRAMWPVWSTLPIDYMGALSS